MVYCLTRWITATRLPVVAVAFITILLWSAPSFAQIYAWRDATGRLVLSDRKLDPTATTFAVPGATTVRVTRPLLTTTTPSRNRFEPLIQEHAARQSLRPELVRAVIQVESGYNPRATSPKGAMGLMQLMPATAQYLGVLNPYDPADNIRGGTTYLRELIDRYDGNEELALAAYNAGSDAVDRYGKQIPPYRETVNYVRKIGSAAALTRSQAPTTVEAARPPSIVYKTVEVVDGRELARYSTERPTSGSFQVVVQ